jgi:hypothetical protein
MVIQAPGGRLAVELDGDAYHGPDRWAADRSRQAILERLGWTFHRVRGSAYYRDPDAALAGLWERLESLVIVPGTMHGGLTPVNRPEPPSDVKEARETENLPDGAEERIEIGAVKSDSNDGDQPPRQAPEPTWSTSQATAVEPPGSDEGAFDISDRYRQTDDAESVGLDETSPIPPRGFLPSDLLPDLPDYRTWQARTLRDTNTASMPAIEDAIVEIVRAESPVLAQRVYELYVRASGGHRVGKNVRQVLNRAAYAAIRSGHIAQLEDDVPGQVGKTLYLPGTPSVVLRRRGERTLEQVPRTEVAGLAKEILRRDPSVGDGELKRLLLTAYERMRLTSGADTYLDECIRLSRRP